MTSELQRSGLLKGQRPQIPAQGTPLPSPWPLMAQQPCVPRPLGPSGSPGTGCCLDHSRRGTRTAQDTSCNHRGLWGHRGQRTGAPGSLIPDIPPNTDWTADRNFRVLSQGIWDSIHKAECGGSGGAGATQLSSHWPAGHNATTPSLAALPRAVPHLLSCKFLL